jgi:adenylate cyclase
MPPSVERKLAAILSADVVGYSRLMAEDEDETVRRLEAYRREITGLVEEHRGRVVDFAGDNFLAEFPTATDAVEAAAEIQRVIKARNAAVPAGRAMEFRIGVHLGEVRVEGERLYGDGVNIAARLEGLAEAGGICISGTVLEQIRRRLELGFDDLGEQPVKNIPDPVHAYRVREASSGEVEPKRRSVARWAVVAAAALVAGAVGLAAWQMWPPAREAETAKAMPELAPLTAIAVLPFDDMSPGRDQDWLADGTAEELIETLSRIAELRVVARSSSFRFRDQQEDVRAIGEKLNVGSLVEGSVRRSGDQVRITAQLIRTGDGYHLWSARYDRGLEDVFEVQQEIAREIADAVRAELGVEEEWSWMNPYLPRDVRAYKLVREGLGYLYPDGVFDNSNPEAIALALSRYREALEIDPDYAQAHGEFGFAHLWRWNLARNPEDLERATASAQRALALDPSNGTAHNLLAFIARLRLDWSEARRLLLAGLERQPRHGPLLQNYAAFLMQHGDAEQALHYHRRAVEADPWDPWTTWDLGYFLWFMDEYLAATEHWERGYQLGRPIDPVSVVVIALAHHRQGNTAAAREAVLRLPAGADLAVRAYEEGGIEGLAASQVEAAVAQSGDRCGNSVLGPWIVGLLRGVAEDVDGMFECLERNARERPMWHWAGYLKVSPVWDAYRDDPRFTALLERMNLAEE